MANQDSVVRIGSRVCVRDGDGDAEFRIVEPHEADAVAERASAESPLGRALLGRRVGDLVCFRAPGGVLAVTRRGRVEMAPSDLDRSALVSAVLHLAD